MSLQLLVDLLALPQTTGTSDDGNPLAGIARSIRQRLSRKCVDVSLWLLVDLLALGQAIGTSDDGNALQGIARSMWQRIPHSLKLTEGA